MEEEEELKEVAVEEEEEEARAFQAAFQVAFLVAFQEEAEVGGGGSGFNFQGGFPFGGGGAFGGGFGSQGGGHQVKKKKKLAFCRIDDVDLRHLFSLQIYKSTNTKDILTHTSFFLPFFLFL